MSKVIDTVCSFVAFGDATKQTSDDDLRNLLGIVGLER
jgi:hypothetical protein